MRILSGTIYVILWVIAIAIIGVTSFVLVNGLAIPIR